MLLDQARRFRDGALEVVRGDGSVLGIRREQQSKFELRLRACIRYAREQRGNVLLAQPRRPCRVDSEAIPQIRSIPKPLLGLAWDGRIAEALCPSCRASVITGSRYGLRRPGVHAKPAEDLPPRSLPSDKLRRAAQVDLHLGEGQQAHGPHQLAVWLVGLLFEQPISDGDGDWQVCSAFCNSPRATLEFTQVRQAEREIELVFDIPRELGEQVVHQA